MTEQKTTPRPETTNPPAKTSEKTSVFADISFSQIVAGALAAVTAAFIASQIGVAGTLAGAAIGSVIGSVGSTVYKGSLQKSHQVVQKVASVAVPKTQATFTAPGLNDTQEIAPIQSWSDAEEVQDIALDAEELTEGTDSSDSPRNPKKYNWRSIFASALISLLMATTVVLLYEKYMNEPTEDLNSDAGVTRIIEQQVIMPEPTEEPEPNPTQTIVIVGPVPKVTEEPEEETPPADVVEEAPVEEPIVEEPVQEETPVEEPVVEAPVEETPVVPESPSPTPTPTPTQKPVQKPVPAPVPTPSPTPEVAE